MKQDARENEVVSFVKDVLLLTLVGLGVTRLSLLLHEFVGHGGVALACGGTIDNYHLFWFGGGWIDVSNEGETGLVSHLILLGGIISQLLLALALHVAGKQGKRVPLISSALIALNVVHGLFYLANGTFYGYGDGRLLFRALGDVAHYFSYAVGMVAVACSWLAGKAIKRDFARKNLPFAVLAMVVAGLCHGALMVGEQQLFQETTYETIKYSDVELNIERMAKTFEVEYREAHGSKPSKQVLDQVKTSEWDKQVPIPFDNILLGGIVLFFVLGYCKETAPCVAELSLKGAAMFATFGFLAVLLTRLIGS